MIFLRLHQYGLLIGGVAALALSIFLMKRAGQKQLWIRIVSSLALAPLGLIAFVFVSGLAIGMVGCESHGPAIYSPSGRAAAMKWNFDGGALGGTTGVVLYRWHGLSSTTVLGEYWNPANQEDVVWIDDTHLLVKFQHFPGYHEMQTCSDAGTIKVQCLEVPEKVYGEAVAPPRAN